MKNKCVVLMPAAQYRIKKLYEHVNNVELIDSRVFTNAIIGANLSLTECYKEKVNKYTYQDILLACSDKEYYEYYKWNIEHNKNIVITALHHSYKLPPEFLSTDLDFVETNRCCIIDFGGSGFGKGGYGYRWNVTKASLDSSWLSWSFYIHFDTKLAKDNFAKWWYLDKKSKSLASKVLGGTPLSSTSNSISYTIPQIDWSNIHINQKELWDKGLYDEAVLAEMNLNWNEDKTKIIQA